MRKVLLLTVIILFSFTSSSQNIDDLEYFNIKDSLTTTLLSEYDYLNAKKTKIKKRLDSIKIEKRIELVKRLEGKWEFIKGVCSDCIMSKDKKKVEKFIQITRKNIIFYQDSISDKNIISKEKLNFSEFFNTFSDLVTLVYSDKSAWSFSTDVTQNNLQVYYVGKEQEGNISIHVSGNFTYYYKRIHN